MEAGELALYMFSVCAFATLLQHPASPVRHFIASALLHRALMGLGIDPAFPVRDGIPQHLNRRNISARSGADPASCPDVLADVFLERQ